MSYNSTTKCYTLKDPSDSFGWIIEGADPKLFQPMTDEQLFAWVDELTDLSKQQDFIDIENRAETLHYPVFGYTTDQVFQDAGEWLAFKRAEIDSDYQNERIDAVKFLRNWIDSVLLSTNEAAALVGVKPLTIKRWIKSGRLNPTVHHSRFNLYSAGSVRDASRRHPGGRKPATPAAQS